MHKNELFFDLVFLVNPLDPPLSLPPSLYPPLEVGPLAIPANKKCGSLVIINVVMATFNGEQYKRCDQQSQSEINDSSKFM